jgi:hypothetical protein
MPPTARRRPARGAFDRKLPGARSVSEYSNDNAVVTEPPPILARHFYRLGELGEAANG